MTSPRRTLFLPDDPEIQFRLPRDLDTLSVHSAPARNLPDYRADIPRARSAPIVDDKLSTSGEESNDELSEIWHIDSTPNNGRNPKPRQFDHVGNGEPNPYLPAYSHFQPVPNRSRTPSRIVRPSPTYHNEAPYQSDIRGYDPYREVNPTYSYNPDVTRQAEIPLHNDVTHRFRQPHPLRSRHEGVIDDLTHPVPDNRRYYSVNENVYPSDNIYRRNSAPIYATHHSNMQDHREMPPPLHRYAQYEGLPHQNMSNYSRQFPSGSDYNARDNFRPTYQNSMKRNKKLRDPKSFDGVKMDWSDYLAHFETVAKWNEWDNEQKAQQLIISLDGEAMKILGQLTSEVKDDYVKLVAEMNRRYDPKERASAYKIKFRGRIRNKQENLMIYAQDLKRLVSRAYPDIPHTSHDHFVLDQFITGLNTIDMRRHVQFGHPKNMDEAISLAIEFEAFEAANRTSTMKPTRGEVTMVRPADDGEDSDDEFDDDGVACPISDFSGKKTCKYCKQNNHTIDTCFKLKNKREWENRNREAPNQGNANPLN